MAKVDTVLKGTISFLFLFFFGFSSQVVGQFTLAQDDASNYSDWNGNPSLNEGFGFQVWTFNQATPNSSSDGRYVGATAIGDPAFGLFSGGDSGAFSIAERNFEAGLRPGDTFRVDIGHTTNINGEIGLNLLDEGVVVWTLKFVAGQSNWKLNDGGSDFNIAQSKNPNASITLEFTFEGNNTYSYSFGTASGSNFTFNGTVDNIDGVRFFNSNQGGGENFGINNLKIISSSTSIELTGTEGFRLLSAPATTSFSNLLNPIWTQGATVGADTQNGDPNVFTWDNTATDDSRSNWTGLTDLSGTISAGTGFLAFVYQDDEFGVTGSFPKTLSVSGQENSAGFTQNANNNANGWALLGNPFASPLSFDDLAKTSLTDVVYVWDVNTGGDPNNNPGAGSWISWNGNAGDITNGIIAPFQGFFVQTDGSGGGSVDFTESAKSTGGEFFGKQPDRKMVRMELSGQGMNNSAWMVFSDVGSFEKTYGDAHQLQPLSGNYALLAAQKTGGLFDIGVLPSPGSDFELPLEVDATLPGSYTLRVTDLSGTLSQPLFLEDRKENINIALNEETEYEFTLDGQPQKTVSDPLALLADGPTIAKSTGESPRFVITAQTAVSIDKPGELPAELSLNQNYPNPFNPATVISYDLPEQSHVTLDVFDITGRKVATLVNEQRSAGTHEVTFDASNLSSGTYIYHLDTSQGSVTRRMTLIK
ncbi:MAG: T9SS type A sorting domain-containing protein [Bacteroidetes bacterium]|jgi:hypothetical protein|nr:T9SS type A sorting domain-containing protein [Bacteroidota bacterium]